MTMKPTVIRAGVLDMQVCVPAEWTDTEVIYFANVSNLSGTSNGWQIRREGSEYLNGAPERIACASGSGNVHIMLDC